MNKEIVKAMQERPKPGLGGIEKNELICKGPEARLIRFIRDLGWGEARVVIKNGAPVMVHSAVKDTKLT